jgi:hypothetical protein
VNWVCFDCVCDGVRGVVSGVALTWSVACIQHVRPGELHEGMSSLVSVQLPSCIATRGRRRSRLCRDRSELGKFRLRVQWGR